ncbi:MAG: Aldehyde dehydrogenase, partial [Negativicoccus succinicivorans DORA_17_25]
MKAKLQKKYDLYIGGEWVAAGDKELIAVHSPIDGKELAKIAEATETDVEKAVVAA